MLRRLDLRGSADPGANLPRPDPGGRDAPVAAVREILAEVRRDGDAALRRLTEQFDGVTLGALAVDRAELAAAFERLEAGVAAALAAAHRNIEAYHRAQVGPLAHYEQDGVRVRELRRPVRRAGCYVPGGRAVYPSTVLMTAVPARVAGVDEVVVCVPPGPDGRVPDVVLAAAHLAGVDVVHPIGGAQAIGAMAYGTESVAPVDVIVGPGNVYVAVAKREVAGVVGVPSSFAGPSEVVVIADGSVAADLAALDVVLQAEHGPDGLAWLVTWDEAVADAVVAAVEAIVAASPRRDEIRATLDGGGYAVVVDGPEAAAAVSDAVAPEHLELLIADPESMLARIHHAGAVFCGPYAPASVGDYAAGPNHVLPTNGTARFAEALRVDDFVKHVHVVDLTAEALAALGPHVATLAEAEGLPAHAESVRRRLDRLP